MDFDVTVVSQESYEVFKYKRRHYWKTNRVFIDVEKTSSATLLWLWMIEPQKHRFLMIWQKIQEQIQ